MPGPPGHRETADAEAVRDTDALHCPLPTARCPLFSSFSKVLTAARVRCGHFYNPRPERQGARASRLRAAPTCSRRSADMTSALASLTDSIRPQLAAVEELF